MDNKDTFARNLKKYMDEAGKSRKEVADAIGVSYYTFSSWANGSKYPRMGKVELLANYFGILKSDLIEEKTPEQIEAEKKADIISDVVLKMKSDPDFLSLIVKISKLEKEKWKSVDQMISAFLK